MARRGIGAYARTVREATPNARRYLLSVALQNVAIGLLGTVFALYVSAAGMSPAVVGDVEGALALASAVVCLLLPPLVSVVGYRWLLVAAGIAFAASRLGQTLEVGATAVILMGLAYGIGDGIMRSVGVAFLSENGPAGSKRTLLFTVDFALRITAAFVGALIGGLVPTLLQGTVGEVDALRIAIAVAGVLFLASAVPVLGVSEKSHAGVRVRATYMSAVRGFSSWGRLTRLAVPEALISFGAGLIMPFVPLFLKVHLSANVAQIGAIQGTASVVMAVATLSTPLLVKRFGLVRTIVFTELASLPFLLTIPMALGLPAVAVAMWARGALMNMSWPIYNQIAVEGVASADKPLVVGWMSVAWSIAWLGGSMVGGRLAESSYTVGYFVTAALYASGALASWLLLRDLRMGAPLPLPAENLTAEAAEPRA